MPVSCAICGTKEVRRMNYVEAIEAFVPQCTQEAYDRQAVLDYVRRNGSRALTREDTIAHITSSGFVMNRALDRVLLVHHNIRGVWAWTGGHVDGNPDFLAVAQREIEEETGIATATPLSARIASVDVLTAHAHIRRGIYVGTHLHLSIAYVFCCDETAPLRVKADENTAVAWFDVDYFTQAHFANGDALLYNKLIARARALA